MKLNLPDADFFLIIVRLLIQFRNVLLCVPRARPYSMSVVCVACEAGVLLWSVDPASVVTRPSGACVTLLPTPQSCQPTVMHPHPQVCLYDTLSPVSCS